MKFLKAGLFWLSVGSLSCSMVYGNDASKNSNSRALKVNFEVTKFVLENGLTVLLHEDHSVPMVSYHTWYRVGSRDERAGITGAAHMLEHMMFKGAKKYSNKDFDRILHENGISNNAFTSWDYTGFYENLPSSKLELIMDVELDRMKDLALRDSDLASELEVVKEERRWRVDNNPQGLLREKLFSELFKIHPYNWPVIGTLEDIANYKIKPLREFYSNFYVPNNAVLVLAGDFDTKSTRAMIESYYGPLKKREIPERKYPQEPELKAPQFFETSGEVQNTSVILAYKGVKSGHPDSYALDLAAGILGQGASGRLHKKLVYEEQNSTSAGSFNMTNADPGVFAVSVGLKPGIKWKKVEKSLRNQIKELKTKLVLEKDLNKARNQAMKGFVDELSTIDGKARSLAVNEILFGDYSRMFTDLERYDQVTPADVKRVVNTYLLDEREVVGILNPKKN